MRTARTIGIRDDGSEAIIHPKSVCITVQLAEFNKLPATGLPKGFVAVEFQPSDSPARILRADALASVAEALARAEKKQKHADELTRKQAEAKAAQEKSEAVARQQKIDAANAAKESEKAALAASKASPKK